MVGLQGVPMHIRLTTPSSRAAVSRAEQLRESLPEVAAMLHRRRADAIGDGIIADLVALDWLEWFGGTLRLTITGSNICKSRAAR